MDLPKNITQIGETNPNCKVYAEDYVISYMKQLNGHAMDKALAVALYGIRREEAGITYLFLYGAARLSFLQRETRHLSQAALQEIEKLRKKYFSQYEFLGYRMLDGEMVEGFHICEQSVCRYIAGYAQFYEKNDSMLNFMLAERKEDAKPEEVDQEKYETVKRRQEERRSQSREYGSQRERPLRRTEASLPAQRGMRRMKMAAAAVFGLLCIVGLGSMDGGQRLNELQTAAKNMIAQWNTRQLPDAVEVNAPAQAGTIVAEDKLTEAIKKENEGAGVLPEQNPSGEPSVTDPTASPETPSEGWPDPGTQGTEPGGENDSQTVPEAGVKPGASSEGETASGTAQETPPEAAQTPAPEPVSYTIQKGDTLIGICIRTYGSDDRVAEICSLNNISNPDDIKIGQKILLP